MIITLYSFIMAIVWFTTFVLIAELLRRKTGFLVQYHIGSMLFLIAIYVVRICIPIETSMTMVIPSTRIFVSIQQMLMYTIDIAGNEISVLTLLLSIWAIGAGGQLVQFISHLRKDSKTVRAIISSKCDDADTRRIAIILEGIVMQTPTYERYQLIISPRVPTPMVTGLFTQKILLPQMISELSDESLYHVLTHEWNHLLGRDVWVKCLVEILRCLMWWNPVVYLLKNSIEQSLEIKCDISVTRHMSSTEKIDYLQTIFLFVERFTKQKTNVLAYSVNYMGITEDFAIRQRFHIVSADQKNNRVKPAVFAVAMSLLLVLSYSFVVQPYTLPPDYVLDGPMDISSKNLYILALADGTFQLMEDGEYQETLFEEHLSMPLHDKLPIFYE